MTTPLIQLENLDEYSAGNTRSIILPWCFQASPNAFKIRLKHTGSAYVLGDDAGLDGTFFPVDDLLDLRVGDVLTDGTEKLLVKGITYWSRVVIVERGYGGTTVTDLKDGDTVYRFADKPAHGVSLRVEATTTGEGGGVTAALLGAVQFRLSESSPWFACAAGAEFPVGEVSPTNPVDIFGQFLFPHKNGSQYITVSEGYQTLRLAVSCSIGGGHGLEGYDEGAGYDELAYDDGLSYSEDKEALGYMTIIAYVFPAERREVFEAFGDFT